jgi:hypothetical protein
MTDNDKYQPQGVETTKAGTQYDMLERYMVQT